MIVKEEHIGGQRLILGDCLQVMPMLGRFDACVTDPPYGIDYKPRDTTKEKRGGNGTAYGRAGILNDHRPPSVAMLLDLSAEQIIWGGNYMADQLPPKASWLVWDKKGGNADFHGKLTFADCELAWCSDGKPARIHQQIWSGLVRQGEEANIARVHPTQKPIRLMVWCLERFSNAQTIIDPYMGSGTTLVACQRMGRNGTGIELDPEYWAISCERVHKAWQQPDLLIPDPKPPSPVQESFLDV